MSDWKFAQKDVSEELALLHHFSFKRQQGVCEVRFVITVKEFAAPPQGQFARFFAQADKHVNQKIAPILPKGRTRWQPRAHPVPEAWFLRSPVRT